MNGYKAFFKQRSAEVYAETSLEAREKAAAFFKAKKSYDVTVVLCETNASPAKPGTQVVHSTAALG
jgi:hypothetical protein